MNRRDFLKRLMGGAAAVVAHELDLDRLLWVPGEKTIFLPSVSSPLTILSIGRATRF